MLLPPRIEQIDYLVIGHLTQDITSAGVALGGTAAYAALTARALGLRVGIVTSVHPEIDVQALEGIPIVNAPAEHTTTFTFQETPTGRQLTLKHVAESLDLHLIPESWQSAPIVHLAPVAQEIPPTLSRHFPDALLGVTPQGWMRTWDSKGLVEFSDWPEAEFVLRRTSAVILSLEDVQGDLSHVENLAMMCSIVVTTLGPDGAIIHTPEGDSHIPAPEVKEVDSIGAGDIFAAAFLFRLHRTQDPLEAARFANFLASRSVTRGGVASTPTQDDIYDLMAEAIRP